MKRVLVLVASIFCLQSYAQTIPDIEMVSVKGGTFIMGCTTEQGDDCMDNEKPAHKVTLSDFYIGKYEITQAQWKAIMGSNSSRSSGCENCPTEFAFWDEVQKFIDKLNARTGLKYRLPTEAEWEYAARGGAQSRGYKYSGSNSVDEVAWYDGNSGNKTHPVGTKKANELGIYDMSGNVDEWCSGYLGAYSSEAQTNPRESIAKGQDMYFQVVRGGSYHHTSQAWDVRVSSRSRCSIFETYDNVGFRLARSSK
jgi:formylglycine-generating enzyme required for sulfatase activity